jgi:dCMP deaminase
MKKPRITPPRDDRYMALAFVHASFSKDPNTHVGSVIVNCDNEIVGTGYNGPPKLFNDTDIDWERPQKYKYIKHAEANAIKHASRSTKGATLYVTGMPCPACMLDIIDAEISKVVYFDFKKHADPNSMFQNDWAKETEELVGKSGIQFEAFQGNINWLRDRIKFMESLGLFG